MGRRWAQGFNVKTVKSWRLLFAYVSIIAMNLDDQQYIGWFAVIRKFESLECWLLQLPNEVRSLGIGWSMPRAQQNNTYRWK